MNQQGRIAARFAALGAKNERALITYLTAFDPDRDRSLALLRACADGGADVLEIGIPWSDPSADGPVIQRAMLRALGAGATLSGVLDLVRELRRHTEVPIVLFGYYNPMLRFGPERFATAARAAGADGVLVVDLPPEEADELDRPLIAAGLDRVPLIAPTTPPERAAAICRAPACRGFAYYVALAGVTGSGHLDLSQVERRAAQLAPHVSLPLAIGFGVRDPKTVAALGALPACAGIVVGSALVQAHERGEDLGALVGALKAATRHAPFDAAALRSG